MFQPMDVNLGPQPLAGMPTPQMPQMPGMAQRHGMFGAGGVGRNIAGMIGDFLMARAGMQPMYAPMMMQQRKLAYEAQLQERQHQQEFQDQRKAHQQDRQFDISNPLPQQPDEITRHMVAAGIDPNSPQGKAMYAASLDPVVMTPQGPMLRSQLLGASAAGQPAPQGVTFTPIDDGGPTPPASGGFPGY